MGRIATLDWFAFDERSIIETEQINRAIYMYLKGKQGYGKEKPVVDEKNNPFLYIGSVYGGTLGERFKKHRDDEVGRCIKENSTFYVIKVAEIKLEANQRITEDLVKAIECCLIFQAQPICNIQCKDKYTGCEGTLIINNGGDYEPLNINYVCSQNDAPTKNKQ